MLVLTSVTRSIRVRSSLLSADADAVCGADYRTVSDERTNRRNGYRHLDFDTRTGTIDVAISKLRQGTYFPDWLLERRKRAERAPTTVVATCYLLGVSTRRMEKLVATLGITSLSKWTASRHCCMTGEGWLSASAKPAQ